MLDSGDRGVPHHAMGAPLPCSSLPLALSTTVSVLQSVGGAVQLDDAFLTVSTPVPGHRWADCLILLDPARVNDADDLIDHAMRAFPQRSHPAIALPARPSESSWRARPCQPVGDIPVEWFPHHWVCLTASALATPTSLDASYQVVSMTDPRLWDAFAALPSPGGPSYQRRWTDLKRQRQGENQARFFVCLHDGLIVGSGGVVLCEIGGRVVGRFEDIHTMPDHRRHGVASHIIAAAHRWARSHGAACTAIVAEADGAANGLYRSLGFAYRDEAWVVLPRRAQNRGG